MNDFAVWRVGKDILGATCVVHGLKFCFHMSISFRIVDGMIIMRKVTLSIRSHLIHSFRINNILAGGDHREGNERQNTKENGHLQQEPLYRDSFCFNRRKEKSFETRDPQRNGRMNERSIVRTGSLYEKHLVVLDS